MQRKKTERENMKKQKQQIKNNKEIKQVINKK